jgi:Transposase
MEATGYARWFERLLAELNFELWVGEAAQIRAMRVRKQKTDRRDAEHLLKLLVEDRFPRIWVAIPENRDLRQLLWHRHRLVQMRTRVMNQLQAIAMNEGVRRKQKLWSKQGRAPLESLPVGPLGHAPATRVVRTARPTHSPHRRVNRRYRGGSRAPTGGATADDASRRRPDYRASLCADSGIAGALPLRQTHWQLARGYGTCCCCGNRRPVCYTLVFSRAHICSNALRKFHSEKQRSTAAFADRLPARALLQFTDRLRYRDSVIDRSSRKGHTPSRRTRQKNNCDVCGSLPCKCAASIQ